MTLFKELTHLKSSLQDEIAPSLTRSNKDGEAARKSCLPLFSFHLTQKLSDFSSTLFSSISYFLPMMFYRLPTSHLVTPSIQGPNSCYQCSIPWLLWRLDRFKLHFTAGEFGPVQATWHKLFYLPFAQFMNTQTEREKKEYSSIFL